MAASLIGHLGQALFILIVDGLIVAGVTGALHSVANNTHCLLPALGGTSQNDPIIFGD
jgi:hypothetical protein